MKEVSINGKVYPCAMTMGALLRFKEMTGKQPASIGGDDIEAIMALLYCCVKSSCKREGIEFQMELLDFADSLDFQSVVDMSDSLASAIEADSEEQKKTASRSA